MLFFSKFMLKIINFFSKSIKFKIFLYGFINVFLFLVVLNLNIFDLGHDYDPLFIWIFLLAFPFVFLLKIPMNAPLLILSVILLNYSFPRTDYYLLAYIAFIPFIFAFKNIKSYKEVLFYMFFYALFVNSLGSYWIYIAMENFNANLNVFTRGIFFLVAISLFTLRFIFIGMISFFLKTNFRLGIHLIFPIAFGLVEFFLVWYLIQVEFIPWYLANSQYKNIYMIQIIEWIGLPGLSMYIVFVNVILYKLILYIFHFSSYLKNFRNKVLASSYRSYFILSGYKSMQNYPKELFKQVLLTLFMTFFFLGFGFWKEYKINEEQKKAYELNVGVVQPNFSHKESYYKIYEKMKLLSKKLQNDAIKKNQHLDIVVWPENPVWFSKKGQTGLIIKKNKDYLLERGSAFYYVAGYIGNEYDVDTIRINYNNVYWTTPHLIDNHKTYDTYTKRYLFPFGEYIPILYAYPSSFRKKAYKFFGIAFFKPGENPTPLRFNENISIASPICYEGLFSRYMLKFIKRGANFIISGSNDMWFHKELDLLGMTNKEADLHMFLTLFRAIEYRVPIVRSTNSGITGMVDRFGRYHDLTQSFVPSTAIYKVHITDNYLTVYAMMADYYPFLLVIVLLVLCGLSTIKQNDDFI